MPKKGVSSLPAGSDPAGLTIFTRENLLVIFLLAIGLSSLIFYLIPPGYYDRRANLLCTLSMLALMPLAFRPRFFAWVVHGAAGISAVLVIYIATESGGVNSMAMVWLNVLPVAVLLLLGPVATLVWIVVALLTIAMVFVATLSGWINPHAHMTQQAVPWVLMNHVMAVGNMMLAVLLYDHLHVRQLMQLARRNEEIKATHQALRLAQAHKDEFVAAVGHELRTPMNAILGFNGVLRQELADQPEQVAVVDHIRRSTEHLLHVVNDILDFSQLQAGKLILHTVDFSLAALMQDALKTLQDKAHEKGLSWSGQIDAQVPSHVHADRQRLLQILRNLLDNALKFTEQGAVQLRISVHEGQLRFDVTDTGRGIAVDRQNQIFRRFEHADDQTTRAYGGTGLGLSICEKLVSLHGGQIGIDSREGQGATFWFQIPLQEAKTAAETQGSKPSGLQDEALRILVVDDNAMNLMVARLQLKKCWPKADIVTADSAAQALILLDEQSFDVALIDMIMPDMDGMQLTAQIRHRFPAITARMPILALTANTNPVDRQRCLDAGMDDVLDKPMDPDTLVRCVSRHIRQARG
jgi:signal transduction histidine kinase/ActR/RegA family two-component response regulator